MSLSDKLNPPKDYILEARRIAESIFLKSPDVQAEMLDEIRDNLVKRTEIRLGELKKR